MYPDADITHDGPCGGGGVTVTVVEHVAVPPEPVTVIVYVVVTEGDTLLLPFNATLPIPWLILALVALDDVQVSE